MTVVFGVDFDSLSPDLALALRSVDSPAFRLACGRTEKAPDAKLVFVAASADIAAVDGDTVAVGSDSFELAALDAGAIDFVVWPSLNQSLAGQLTASARRITRLHKERGAMAGLRKTIETLEGERDSFRALADTDPLTGLLNRRRFVAAADDALRRGAGRRPGVAVLMIDLDQFKAVNDAHGHAAGDAVLVAVAKALTVTLRDGDVVGRVGGEEFAVVLTRVDHDQSVTAAERVRAAIEACAVPLNGKTLRTTASIGLASVSERIGQEEAFRRADAALYRAKSDGRNRVVQHRDADVMAFPGRASV